MYFSVINASNRVLELGDSSRASNVLEHGSANALSTRIFFALTINHLDKEEVLTQMQHYSSYSEQELQDSRKSTLHINI